MADVCFSKLDIVAYEPWIELQLRISVSW